MPLNRENPSPELLRKLLRYEPDTGLLFWRERDLSMFKRKSNGRGWNTRYTDTEAGAIDGKGYLSINVLGRLYIGHRVIWAMVHGKWPTHQIDHIDGNRLNNRIENMRDVTSQDNGMNAAMNSKNTSGHAGVYLNKRSNLWCAQMKHLGRTYHLGSGRDFDAVVALRKAEERRLGFTERHGTKCI
jgi:hypothetical protein